MTIAAASPIEAMLENQRLGGLQLRCAQHGKTASQQLTQDEAHDISE
jgi:hypothetical protein